MSDLVGIRARQAGRKSRNGPQPGQEFVRTMAFLVARNDIDKLLDEVERLQAELERQRAQEGVR